MLSAPGNLLCGGFCRFANIEKEASLGGVPVDERHVSAQRIGGDHPSEVHRILGAAELGRVAKFGFFQIVDGRVQLQGP